jgi:hypothetical protein
MNIALDQIIDPSYHDMHGGSGIGRYRPFLGVAPGSKRPVHCLTSQRTEDTMVVLGLAITLDVAL